MLKLAILNFFVFFLFLVSSAQGPLDGYFKGKKVLDLAFSGGVQTATTYTGANGPFSYKRTLPMASIFAEYGITNRLDVIASLPFISNTFQDAGLYIKAKLIDKGLFTLAPGVGFSTPISNYNTEIKNAVGQRATAFHGHLIAQSPLGNAFSLQVQGAYHYTLEPVPSSYTFSGKLIFSKNKWYSDVWYEYQKGLGDITFGGTLPYTSFREFFVDYHRIGGVVYKSLENNWGAFINASTILKGVNTFNTTTVMVGCVKKLDFNK